MVIFYTSIEGLEPTLVCYPYIVINPFSFDEGLRYISICRKHIKSILIDTGVEKLFKYQNLKDYPKWFVNDYVNMIRHLSLRYGSKYEIIYTIPDIPCDYPNRESLYPWNIQRTIEYIEIFLSKYIDELKPSKPLAPVQGKRDSIKSVIDTYIKYEHIFNQFEIIALAPVCTTKKYKLLSRMILAFDRTVSRPFHAFGVHIKSIEYVLKWKTKRWKSFDSSAYKYVNKGSYILTKKREETYKSFINYIEKLKKLGVIVI